MAMRPTKSQATQEKSPPSPPQSSFSPTFSSSSAVLSQALAIVSNLANLLPTGTLLAFQLLVPVFTKNGSCDPATRLMTLALLLLLAASAFVACFTDSFRLPDGRVFYGLATPRGMWLFETPPESSASEVPDLSKYRLRVVDFVHAALAALVFGVVALRDKNVVECFYPSPETTTTKEVLDILPLGIGVICSMLFVVFPTTRNGVGRVDSGGVNYKFKPQFFNFMYKPIKSI
ncbi:hypothetical protein AXF42_Ash013884 [Apostasia shenzhenica]|uniref:Protein DMP6 n=1 Tax=Apostasia shenzhenica TaxID=1088818 RepID=A0A2I0AS53_9ASPA|nr:hypothetical protein AXF42_Ash013884 [Apostasia shenzhenica]